MSVYDPPSPCRRLLRDTLLRDQSLRSSSTASLPAMHTLASPPSTPARRGLSPAPRSEYSPSRPRHHQHHHSSSFSQSPSSPMRPRTGRQGVTEAYSPIPPHTAHPTTTHTRENSHSPLSAPHVVTPHGQVLRARLERVLMSNGLPDDVSKRRKSDGSRGRNPNDLASLNGSARAHKRNRSKTESHIPPHPSHFLHLGPNTVSPRAPHTQNDLQFALSRSASLVRQKKRTSTGSASASRSGSGSAKRSGPGATPPLIPDDEGHESGEGEPRPLLLTPPSTPSPPGFGYFHVSDWRYRTQCYDPNNTRELDDEEDDEEDNDDDSSSSYSSYREGSSISSSAIPSLLGHHQSPSSPFPQPKAPLSPKAFPASPHTPTRPFNARRASAQCRAIEGYVSFANVEGLGVPADEAAAAACPSDEKGGKGMLMALGWGGGMVRKILGGAEKQSEEGAVVH